METLTDLVQAEFKLLVTEGTWLTDRTKKLAEEKIEAIVRNIGYPDFILDDVMLQTEVEGLNYQDDEFFENVLKNLRWRTIQEMGRLDERVNRTLWTATPAVVNAYYSRNKNQISKEKEILLKKGQINSIFFSVSGGYFTTSILPQTFPQKLELRRYRSGHRSRNHSRIRR